MLIYLPVCLFGKYQIDFKYVLNISLFVYSIYVEGDFLNDLWEYMSPYNGNNIDQWNICLVISHPLKILRLVLHVGIMMSFSVCKIIENHRNNRVLQTFH